MDPLLTILRLVHILCASIWVGIGFFMPYFLAPALAEAGPDAGKVMGALQKRGIMTLLPLVAIATLISGFWLYWRMSAGEMGAFSATPMGSAFGFGGIVALIAWIIGMTIVRPSMMKAAAIMQSIASAQNPEERTRLIQSANSLRTRSARAGKLVAILLLTAASAMAVARYM
jgi:uncharacterized membrane protein